MKDKKPVRPTADQELAQELAKCLVVGVFVYDTRRLFDPTRSSDEPLMHVNSIDYLIGRLQNGLAEGPVTSREGAEFVGALCDALAVYGVGYGTDPQGKPGCDLDEGTTGPGWGRDDRPEWAARAREVEALLEKECEDNDNSATFLAKDTKK